MRRFIFALVFAASAITVPTLLLAQFPQYTTHRVRIYNETGVEIRVKIVGFETEAFALRELDVGEKALIPRMLQGHRVFIAWDDVTQEVVSSGVIYVDSNMRVRFRPQAMQSYSSAEYNFDVERVEGEP